MEHAAGHPLKREKEKSRLQSRWQKMRVALGGQRARGWRDLRYKSGVEPPQSK